MKSVLFLTNIPAPYTVEFFNELGKYVELFVMFEDQNASERDSSWSIFSNTRFQYCILSDLKSTKEKIKRVRKEINSKYDLIIVGNYSTKIGIYSIINMKIRRIPYAIHADGGIIATESVAKRAIKTFLLKGAALYFSSGEKTSLYFRHYGAQIGKIRQYPFSSVKEKSLINIEDKERIRAKYNLPQENVIVSVGQIIPRKGFDVLLRSMSLLKNRAYLYIIGGNPTNNLKELIKELNLKNVTFISFLPNDSILEYMAASDLFVLLTREDIWGLVINEALSTGTPIISTDRCVAALELIEDGINGYVVESENPAMAAEKIDYLLENKTVREKMRQNNIEKASKYTIENMAKTYNEIIDDYFFEKTREKI